MLFFSWHENEKGDILYLLIKFIQMASKQKNQYRQAEDMLELAIQEMFKAEEDVVVPSVCINSRNAILQYMKSFLQLNGVKLKEINTLESLRSQCSEINEEFQDLDLTAINCRFETEHDDYCEELGKVKECVEVARKIQQLVNC